MMFAVYVRFLPGGSIPPEEFFARINAQWYRMEDADNEESGDGGSKRDSRAQAPRAAICIADFDSIEQLSIDLAVMPGAGLANVEMAPLAETIELQQLNCS